MNGWEVELVSIDPQVEAMQELLRADHEAWIAEVQQWADDAGAAGDVQRQRRHLDHVARLKAMLYPWQQSQAA
jgi:hypothetical protein